MPCGDDGPVEEGGADEAAGQEAAAGGRHGQREERRAATAFHADGQIVVLHERNVAEAAALQKVRPSDELRLVSPGTPRDPRPQVDHERREAEASRAFLEANSKAAKVRVRERVEHCLCRATGQNGVGVEKHERVMFRHARSSVELPRAHGLRFEDGGTVTTGDVARRVVARSVADEDFCRAGGKRRVDGRSDASLLVARGDDDSDRHQARDVNVTPPVNCYILTGGRSTRMGRSKTDLFLGKIIAAATPVFEELVAVEREGGAALSIRTIHESAHADDGPVFGVLRALEDAAGRCVILAVDYALITSDVLRQLRARVESSAAPLVVPVRLGIPQPLCAGYSPELRPMIERRVSRRTLDLMTLISEAGGETFDLDVPELMNVNTPADLAEAERLR